MGPRCVSILPLGKVACAGLSGNIELVLVRHAYNIIVDVFFFFFFDGTVAALTTACGKFFSTCLSRIMLQVQTQLASLQMCLFIYLFIYPLLSAAAFGFGCARVPNEPSVPACRLKSRVRLGRLSSALPLGHEPFSLAAPEKQR